MTNGFIYFPLIFFFLVPDTFLQGCRPKRQDFAISSCTKLNQIGLNALSESNEWGSMRLKGYGMPASWAGNKASACVICNLKNLSIIYYVLLLFYFRNAQVWGRWIEAAYSQSLSNRGNSQQAEVKPRQAAIVHFMIAAANWSALAMEAQLFLHISAKIERGGIIYRFASAVAY